MKIKVVAIAKTEAPYINTGIEIYLNRLRHYVPIEYIEIPNLKNAAKLSKLELKNEEGKLMLKHSEGATDIILLDDKGKEYTSIEFAKFLQTKLNAGIKTLVFFIGGAFGFSEEVYAKANQKVSLSKLTFSHQMVRLFFLEQLYRGFTIIKGEGYHHE